MVFRRLGGFPQLLLESAADLEHVQSLDEARWVANSAPVDGLNCDLALRSFLDDDANGRIGPDEVKRACRWMLDMLTDRSDVGKHDAPLRLAAIDRSHDEGRQIHAAARRILVNLGAADHGAIHLEQVRDRAMIMAAAATNGDGVIPAGVADTPALALFIEDIGATTGFQDDASGRPGVTEAHLESFLSQARALLEWRARAGPSLHGAPGSVMPLGDLTEQAWDALSAIRAKVDAYFDLCQLSCFDNRVVEQPGLGKELPEGLATRNAQELAAFLEEIPVARPRTDGKLDLSGWLNPYFRDALLTFHRLAIAQDGHEERSFTRWEWVKARDRLVPHEQWLNQKPETTVHEIPQDRLELYTSDPSLETRLRDLLAADKEVGDELLKIKAVEKLILYQRFLLDLVNCFVSFTAFYDPGRRSLLEMGTLVMDGRRFSLCLSVSNLAEHKKLAAASMIFLLYVRVGGPTDKGGFHVAVAVTSPVRGSLYVGKRGVFVCTDGRVRSAVVVDIAENPISVTEAVRSVFSGIGGLLTRFGEKLSATRNQQLEKTVEESLARTASSLEEIPTSSAAEPAPAVSAAGTRDLLVGGGIAVAALSSSLAYIANTLVSINLFQLLVTITTLLALALVPTVIVAFIKLGRRDLSRVLEAGGWAINHELKVRRDQGTVFSWTPALPANARHKRGDMLDVFKRHVPHEDPFLQRRRTWLLLVLLLVLLALALFLGTRV